jgi:Tol biopolymer transport system component
LCDKDGSNPAQLNTGCDGGMKWSPDGQNIAFFKYGDNDGIYVISANGGAPRHLTTGGDWPFWSREGQSIYFRSNRSGTSQIWKMPAGGGDAVQISRDKDGTDTPHESPDGRFVYYGKGCPAPSSVWRLPVEGGEATKVLDGVHPEALWTVGRDGIYFFAKPDEKGHSDLSIYEFGTGKTRKILTIERPVTWYVEVSPDGRTILYTQVDEVGSDLMLVENFR